jgi:Na+/melibiose symporter-like transporter
LLSGLWTASETGMFAVGPAVVGGLLAVFGFVSSGAHESVRQPASAVFGVVLAAGLLPGLLVAASVLRFRRYDEAPASGVPGPVIPEGGPVIPEGEGLA